MLGIFLDTETNGLNTQKHHIIEIAYKIVDIQTGAIQDTYETTVFASFEEWKKSDPLSLKVNGFSWNTIKEGEKTQVVAEEIKHSFKTCSIQRGDAIFICQNPSFDRAFFTQIIDADVQEQLNWPYHWLDLASMFWMKCLLEGSPKPWETGVSKNTIAAIYNLPAEASPHKAMNGVDHLIECYKAIAGFPDKK
jgi:DNA polymerase-3 subunit epsilon/oligoribonuclease